MTKRDYIKMHEGEALDIAMRQHPGKNTAYWAAEANLIVHQWYDDYIAERD